MALTQLHSIYHIDKYRFTICAIFLVIMLDTMFISAYILAAMAGSIFAASCICAIASTSCILAGPFHLHHEYAWHIYRTSFYLFWGSHAGAYGTHSHESFLTLLLYAPSAPLPLVNSYYLVLPPLVVCFLWHGQAQGCIT